MAAAFPSDSPRTLSAFGIARHALPRFSRATLISKLWPKMDRGSMGLPNEKPAQAPQTPLKRTPIFYSGEQLHSSAGRVAALSRRRLPEQQLGVRPQRGKQRLTQRGSGRQQLPGRGRSRRTLKPVDMLNFVDGQKRVSGELVLPDDWLDLAYEDASKPVHLDIGSARGRFCLEYAKLNPDINALGVDFLQQKVLHANTDRRQLALPNCFFLLCDATTNLDQVLAHITHRSCLRSLSIQFPVPDLEREISESSTRLVTPARVQAIAEALAPGGFVFLQSEVEDTVHQMRECFRENDLLQDADSSLSEWLSSNPMGVMTEWEANVVKNGIAVRRCMLWKRDRV